MFYAALFLIYGINLPYLPVWLHWRQLSASEIAAITAAPYLLRLMVTPAAALLADRSANHRLVIIVLAWTGLAAALMLGTVSGFWPILCVSVAFALAVTSIMPLTETIAVRGVRVAGLDYGRMRLWGSLSFILAGICGGAVVDSAGAGSVLWLLIVGAVCTVAAAHALPHAVKLDSGVNPANAKHHHASRPFDAAAKITRSPIFLMFLAGAGLVQGSHALFYTFGTLHWQSQGLSAAWIGALWAVGILVEVAVFAFSGVLVAYAGPVPLVIAAAAAAVLRWSVMAFDPPSWALVMLQALHGLSFGAAHLGAIHFIARAVPEGAAGTAQALYATSTAGIFMGLAMLASGRFYADLSGLAYISMAGFAAAGLMALVIVWRRWNGKALW